MIERTDIVGDQVFIDLIVFDQVGETQSQLKATEMQFFNEAQEQSAATVCAAVSADRCGIGTCGLGAKMAQPNQCQLQERTPGIVHDHRLTESKARNHWQKPATTSPVLV